MIKKSVKVLVLASVCGLIFSSSSIAQDAKKGKEVFQRLGCTACHSESSSAVAPSVKEISKAYAGKPKKLEDFLLGKREPIIDKSRFEAMKPFINLTKKISPEERQALVKYILSF
jgi:cytochrome c551/c552